MERKIEEFYKMNNINLSIIEKVDSKQLTTFFGKIEDYNVRTINKIIKLQDVLCLYLKKDKINIRQNNTKGCIVFEIPRQDRITLSYQELTKEYTKKNNGLLVGLGQDTENKVYNLDLCKTPHLLVGGTTGSGKSVLINTMLTTLMKNYTPKELELLLIDVKQVEFSIYNNVPHLLTPPITTLEDTKVMLNNTIECINARYNILKNNNCRNIQEFNSTRDTKMKYRIVVIDELAELFMLENKTRLQASLQNYDRIETTICRIAQVGRACGVHLIVATQRPSADVISGLIKSNIPSRIGLSVASSTDSKVILDKVGAERLLGKGDMLLKLVGSEDLVRLQGAFISDKDQLKFIEEIKEQYKDYCNDITKIIEENKKEKEQDLINEEYLNKVIEDNIRYTIENNTKLSYNTLKDRIYDFSNRDILITTIAKNDKELDYLKSNYLKIANKILNEYDKLYKNKERIAKNNVKRVYTTTYSTRNKKEKKHTGAKATFIAGCGLYGFFKGMLK